MTFHENYAAMFASNYSSLTGRCTAIKINTEKNADGANRNSNNGLKFLRTRNTVQN